MIAFPAGLMLCFSSSDDSALNDSIRVSNAESQFALPSMHHDVLLCQRDLLAERIRDLDRSCGRRGAAGVSAAAGGVAGAAGPRAPTLRGGWPPAARPPGTGPALGWDPTK